MGEMSEGACGSQQRVCVCVWGGGGETSALASCFAFCLVVAKAQCDPPSRVNLLDLSLYVKFGEVEERGCIASSRGGGPYERRVFGIEEHIAGVDEHGVFGCGVPWMRWRSC